MLIANSLVTKQPLNANLTAVAALAAAPFAPQAYDAYSAGTAYALTATPAALTFGTTQPSITITVAGTYRIRGRVVLQYNGATFAASRTVTLKLRRTNNTAADLTNGSTATITSVVTTLTGPFLVITLPDVLYITVNINDAVTIFADVGVVPTVGSLDATEASIHAQRVA